MLDLEYAQYLKVLPPYAIVLNIWHWELKKINFHSWSLNKKYINKIEVKRKKSEAKFFFFLASEVSE